MGYERAVKAINLESTDRIPAYEWLMHPGFIERATGIDPYRYPKTAVIEAYRRLELDILPQNMIPTETPMYFAEGQTTAVDVDGRKRSRDWGVTGSVWGSRFRDANGVLITAIEPKTVDDLLRFEPRLLNRGLPKSRSARIRRMAEFFEESFGELQAEMGGSALVVPGYPFTLFHNMVSLFGWELSAVAIAQRSNELRLLFAKFADRSIEIHEAWAKTSVRHLFYSHDDISGTQGPLCSPNWFREYIFPWYREIWAPLKEKGVKVVFISDGNIDPFLDDLVEQGADGFFVDTPSSLERAVARYGGQKILFGNVSTFVLTFGDTSAIVREVERCISETSGCRGYFFNAAGCIPGNVPIENVETYFKACRRLGALEV